MGRFAPSPSGPLHFGSLVTALASWLDARAVGGCWLLRIEDVDAPRTVPGAADAILRLLDAYHLHWDGAVLWQHQRLEAYAAALARLRVDGRVYPCHCSRKMLATAPLTQDGSHRYPGTCRTAALRQRAACAWRLRVEPGVIHYHDRVQGAQAEDVAAETGDFILRRADGYIAYQLAVVVDDAASGVTEVVRGADLLPATARQIALQQALGLPTPGYLHVPLVRDAQGAKLSKQTAAPALEPGQATEALTRALRFLAHPPPQELLGAPPATLLAWAMMAWNSGCVKRDRPLG